jgi:hypothetical protein
MSIAQSAKNPVRELPFCAQSILRQSACFSCKQQEKEQAIAGRKVID